MQDTGTNSYPRSKSSHGVAGEPTARGEVRGGQGVGVEDEEGPVGLDPYPLRAAAILEDAYQVTKGPGLGGNECCR